MLGTAADILFDDLPDNGMLPFICRLDSKEEVYDEKNWEKANPSLPYLPTLMGEMRKEYNDWLAHPERLTAFMTKRMNIPSGSTDIKVCSYEKIKLTNREIPDLSGWTCTCGIDFSKITDLVSVNLHFRDENIRYDINHSWLCSQSKDIQRIKAPLEEWRRRGLLTMVDNYVRQVLTEALANGLEYGIVNGTGKDMPIGMARQVGDGVNVVSGEYPEKETIKMTALDMIQLGNVTSIMARNSKGQARTVDNLIMIVNPVDYWKRILPATRAMSPDGVYVSTLPIPLEIIQSAAVTEGTAVYGMAGKYFLGVGMSKNGKIEYSDEYRFLEDERVYLIKLYAHGFALDNNAFVVLDITDLHPVRFEVVSKQEEHVDNALLSDLRIGGLTLSPKFDSDTNTYTAKTTTATNTITAFPKSGTASALRL